MQPTFPDIASEISIEELDLFIENAINEDVGDGDHTSLACVSEDKQGEAKLLIKENGVIAGVQLAGYIFNKFNSHLQLDLFKNDGEEVVVDEIVFEVKGQARAILTAERLVLNCMQRMSGIATITNKIVKEIVGLNTKILDSRKTTPGMRFLEKWAVRIGGGINHRMGLHDEIMIKDNHVDFAGGIQQAIENTRDYLKETGKDLKVVVETRNIDDVKKVAEIGGVDRIMFDNFSPGQVEEGISIIGNEIETEASGGITIDNARGYAETGVNYISIGALTHSVKSLDLSLLVK
ncbi:MAG: nicotinate-nucleotide diphosphorylase (carboxylating) [Bacteroidetes bacterium]|nr:MAG: nicotinate-nucleotide diphosphorylase (carboxylating) [Bacteroidota bacterium]